MLQIYRINSVHINKDLTKMRAYPLMHYICNLSKYSNLHMKASPMSYFVANSQLAFVKRNAGLKWTGQRSRLKPYREFVGVYPHAVHRHLLSSITQGLVRSSQGTRNG